MSLLCRVVGVSRSGFYAWQGRPPSAHATEDKALAGAIAIAHRQSRGTYGSPRVHAVLHAEGRRTSRKRIIRLMQAQHLAARRRRRFRRTTQSKHGLPVADNVLARQFEVAAPNVAWVTDITYVPTREGWLYLATIVDLFSRRVVGWSMSASLETTFCLDALHMALRTRKPSHGSIGRVYDDRQGCFQASHAELAAALVLAASGPVLTDSGPPAAPPSTAAKPAPIAAPSSTAAAATAAPVKAAPPTMLVARLGPRSRWEGMAR